MSEPRDDMGWADRPEVRQRIRYVLYAICAALVVADLVVHRHVMFAMERIPAFYALYGFVALVAVVLLAKGLRRLVGRPEDYYENGGGDA
jgi:branched-subunit amino acid transport protein